MRFQNDIRLKHGERNIDAMPIVEPMFALKEREFYESIDAITLPNVTTECLEDFVMIAAVLMNTSDMYPGFQTVFDQSKGHK